MNHFECTLFKFENGKATPYTLSLEEITTNEHEGKELIGKAYGLNINHCVYLGTRHCKDFLERVKWYYISNDEDAHLKELRAVQLETIKVEFYGELKV